MDFETKEEKLYSDLLDKAYDDFFIKNETNTPVARFAMNWYKFGKQRVVMELNVSADLWIIPLEDFKRHFFDN